MSSRSWQLRIQDILERITTISESTKGISIEEVQRNEILTKAILYDILIIGEATANIETNIKAKHPHIPWREMSDMRNRVAHEYFRVSLEIVWDTIVNDLPILETQLQELLKQEQENI